MRCSLVQDISSSSRAKKKHGRSTQHFLPSQTHMLSATRDALCSVRRHLAAAPAQDNTPLGPAARTLTIKPAATAVNATAVIPSTINDPASDRAVDPVAAANASAAGQGSAPASAPPAGASSSAGPGQPLPSTTNDPNAASAVHPQPASGRCAAPLTSFWP